MALPLARLSMCLAFVALSACGSDVPLEPAGGTFSLGQSVAVESGRDIRILPGSTDGEFVAVVANLALDSISRASYTLRGEGVQAASSAIVPSSTRAAEDHAIAPLQRDAGFESRLRDRERVELTSRFASARSWNASRVPSLPPTLNVGDVVRMNVNLDEACANPKYRAVRVMAIGAKALVLADTLNPSSGFSTTDFQRFAARFDTLVYPLDVDAFGVPTDIDKNGHIAIVFTRVVNELTKPGAISYVGGLTFVRDLFPQIGSARTSVCAGSNEGEIFYVMTPDPTGSINGNRRSTAFVDSTTTPVLAHEFVHLINGSRKLYVNTTAPQFEVKWLDEGLAHVAEELLFYHESGLSPRTNLSYPTLVGSPRARDAYFNDMSGNVSRYDDFLGATATNSPYAAGDALPTRGAVWSLLRFLADQRASSDGDIWSRLVDNTASGVDNLKSVFGRDIEPLIRSWAVSLALDDVANAPAELQQKSWNFRSVYSAAGGLKNYYPLEVTTMATATSYTRTVAAGGAVFYKLSVPANGTATLSLGGQSGVAGSNLQLVIVRTK